MDADGGDQRRLTDNRHDDFQPSWSPDGNRITFTSGGPGGKIANRQIHMIDADGGNQRRPF